MPCYDSRNDPENIWDEARRDFRHNSDVAEMLCTVLRLPRNSDLLHEVPGLSRWWKEHQERDARKKAREERKHANNLTAAKEAVEAAQKNLERLLREKK